jgi:tetratricopeptide (TPR) repeat protein
MEATIDWSYRLLTDDQAATLRRLSVFVGGFTIESAAVVTGRPDTQSSDTTELVLDLVERSLVSRVGTIRSPIAAGQMRYSILEPIRQFAARRLETAADGAERAQATAAHCRFFTELATRAGGALSGRQQGHWFVSLEWDYRNLETAIQYWLDTPTEADRALQMIVQLDRFWHNRGRLGQCASFLRRAIEATGDEVPIDLRSDSLRLAGDAALDRDLASAASYYDAALSAARNADDDYHAARALRGLAQLYYRKDQQSEAESAGWQSVELARRVGDPVLRGECLIALGLALIGSDLVIYRQVHEEAIIATQSSGDLTHLGWAHNNYGNGFLLNGELFEARHHFERSRAIFADLGTPNPTPLVNLGWVSLYQGDLDAACQVFAEALVVAHRHQLRFGGALGILGLACAATRGGDYERGATLIGFADAEFERFGSAAWPDPEASYRAEAIEIITRTIGSGFRDAYELGRINERQKMLTFALEQSETSSVGPGGSCSTEREDVWPPRRSASSRRDKAFGGANAARRSSGERHGRGEETAAS